MLINLRFVWILVWQHVEMTDRRTESGQTAGGMESIPSRQKMEMTVLRQKLRIRENGSISGRNENNKIYGWRF